MVKEENYENLPEHPRILKRPGTYIGSILSNEEKHFLINEKNEVECKIINYNSGLIKIFDEVLVNAIDHSVKNDTVTEISVEINKKEGFISITNNGPGIPIKKQKNALGNEVYIPEMISSHLGTSTNYDDTKERTVGGLNGLGLKACNIFSKKFIIETVDSNRKLYYKQEITNNMYNISEPEIKKCDKKSFTKITFYPDLQRFKLKSLSDDIIGVMKKRTYDIKACVNKKVKVLYNNNNINIKDFIDYTKLYKQGKPDAYERIEFKNYIWEIAVYRNDSYQQVSFVNGVYTSKGGKHVEYITKQITKKLLDLLLSKKKLENVKAKYIQDHLFLFIRATINQPEFSSQSKEEMTTSPTKFFTGKEKIEISDDFINKLYKCGIIQDIIELTNFKNQKEISKTTDGCKKVKLHGILNLDDAIWAGTKKSNECSLILTEGLSAATFAKWGRGSTSPDKYGIYALKGKVLNIRSASVNQILNNTELNNLKQILGLKENEIYKDTNKLRYGKVIILTDADCDGSHIKGLVINFFHAKWPSLLELNYIQTIRTPILIATKKGKKTLEFFNEQDYEKQKDNLNGYTIKYYKGLGTSKKEEAIDIFKRKKDLEIQYYRKDQLCDTSILLAFDKDKNASKISSNESNASNSLLKCSDQRKEWLRDCNRDEYINVNEGKVSYQDFINKELKWFSMYDNQRSIPSLCDGLKPSTRKILYYTLKKNITKDIKVAQLSGYISAEMAYHHGEVSLQEAIIGMAQNYTGSNNINLLYPSGNFGSLFIKGDAASPRYIFTRLEEITKKIFHPDDLPILDYLEDDGDPIEPMYFLPIIPMILVNGSEGIGTGFSTNIPMYNPSDIITNIKRIIENEKPYKLTPWFNKFNGIIEKETETKYIAKGKWERISDTKIIITQLPIGTYVTNYYQFLESLLPNNENKRKITIKSCENYTKDENDQVKFEIEFRTKKELDEISDLEKEFKLTKNINTTNMHLFNKDLILTKYTNPNEILVEFYHIRLNFYKKRREYLIKKLQRELDIISAKTRFIKEYTDDILDINKKPKKYIMDLLEKRKYPVFEPENNYDYLITMQISSISLERIQELEKLKDKKQQELDYYKNSTIQELWLKDIEELEEILE
jgi:DNA topoisomerase-2